ncbi:MAG: hypothetical protein WB559_00095, partial [Candidatus Acidiferrales bacterium]
MPVKPKVSATPLAGAVAAAALLVVLLVAINAARASFALADDRKPARGQIDLKRLMAADQHPAEWLTTGRDFGKGH